MISVDLMNRTVEQEFLEYFLNLLFQLVGVRARQWEWRESFPATKGKNFSILGAKYKKIKTSMYKTLNILKINSDK